MTNSCRASQLLHRCVPAPPPDPPVPAAGPAAPPQTPRPAAAGRDQAHAGHQLRDVALVARHASVLEKYAVQQHMLSTASASGESAALTSATVSAPASRRARGSKQIGGNLARLRERELKPSPGGQSGWVQRHQRHHSEVTSRPSQGHHQIGQVVRRHGRLPAPASAAPQRPRPQLPGPAPHRRRRRGPAGATTLSRARQRLVKHAELSRPPSTYLLHLQIGSAPPRRQ